MLVLWIAGPMPLVSDSGICYQIIIKKKTFFFFPAGVKWWDRKSCGLGWEESRERGSSADFVINFLWAFDHSLISLDLSFPNCKMKDCSRWPPRSISAPMWYSARLFFFYPNFTWLQILGIRGMLTVWFFLNFFLPRTALPGSIPHSFFQRQLWVKWILWCHPSSLMT